MFPDGELDEDRGKRTVVVSRVGVGFAPGLEHPEDKQKMG